MNIGMTQPQSYAPAATQAATPILAATDLVMDYAATQPQTAAATTANQAAYATSQHTFALNHVNFQVNAGETVAVMGPSGSGKSTLLHVIAGIQKPTSGQVLFRDANGMMQNLAAISDDARTELRRKAFGFVFQSGQLLPELPAVENIALPMMLGGMSYDQATNVAMQWLGRMGLAQLANQRPGEMSGGQMQRVAIARALAPQPSVVFADEPTGALDQNTGQEVMSILMQAAAASGAAVIVVTHDQNVANFCSRTVHMRDGQLQDAAAQTTAWMGGTAQ